MGEDEALELASRVDEIVASKGKRVVRLDLRGGRVTREEVLAVLLGPSGNLRAPALVKGRTLLVGFDEGSYRAILA